MFSRGLSEIVLVVDDVKEAARFYRDVVDLAPHGEADDSWAWFWAGEPGQAQRLALTRGNLLFEEKSPLPEGKRWGRVHFAYEVPREKLDEAVAHVRDKGVEVYGPVYFEWMKAKSFYFYDLDENLLEFWSPDPPETNESGMGT